MVCSVDRGVPVEVQRQAIVGDVAQREDRHRQVRTRDRAHARREVDPAEVPLPDNRSYRIDTFMVWTTPPGGDPVKQVTVVVRKPGAPATLVRVVSTFGEKF